MASSSSTRISSGLDQDRLGPGEASTASCAGMHEVSPAARGAIYANRVSRRMFEVILAGAAPQQLPPETWLPLTGLPLTATSGTGLGWEGTCFFERLPARAG